MSGQFVLTDEQREFQDAMTKRLSIGTRSQVVDRALRLRRRYGYLMDYVTERTLRILRAHSLVHSTNQIIRLITGRELTQP